MLHQAAISFAKSRIAAGAVDKTDGWSFSAADGDKILGNDPQPADWVRYGDVHLRKNADQDEQTKAAWSYPFAKDVGGSIKVFRAGLIAIRQRAGQQNESDIFDAAGSLLDLIDPPSEQQSIDMPMISRTAELRSFNEETRTAQVVMSRGSQVLRQDGWTGQRWLEELSLEPGAVRLQRVKDGAVPFAKNHGSVWGMTIEDVMGRVVDATVGDGALSGPVQFSRRPDVQPFIQDIKDGILRSVSVGYVVHKMEKVGEQDGMPILRATDWELYELSSVAMPADSGAQFRSEAGSGRDKPKLFKCEVRGMGLGQKTDSRVAPENVVENSGASNEDQNTGERDVMTEAERIAAEKAAQEKRDADLKAAKELGVKAERERQAEIRKAVRAAKLDESFAEELIADENVTVDAARGKVIDKLAAADKQTRTVSVVAGAQDETETRRAAMKEAILHRGNSEVYKVTERGREFAGLTLMEMARESLRRQGVSLAGMSRTQIAMRALHTTSDFANITADIINKSLRDSFVAAPQTFGPFTRRVSNPDFKQISRVQLGMGSALQEIGEDGEVTYGTMSDSSEKYSIKEYAKAIAISRKTLINDDLNAFVRIPAQMGLKARSLESDLVWAVLTANAAMADGIALFHASHGNLGTAAVISITSLGEARKLLRQQKELDGEPLNLSLRYLAVPSALETVAEQYVTQVQPNDQSKVNPFAPGGRTPLQIAVEPRLDASSGISWYGMTSLDQCDMIELATLSESQEPEVLTEEGFDVLGMKFRVVHSVGVKAIDYRGLVKNAGA